MDAGKCFELIEERQRADGRRQKENLSLVLMLNIHADLLTAVFMYLDHTLISVFLSSFASLRTTR